MPLPPTILSYLNDSYEGVAAARFASGMEAKDFESLLRSLRLSYRTRITRSRLRGREFLVMVLEPAHGT